MDTIRSKNMPNHIDSVELLHSILQYASDGLIVTGEGGQIELYNRACEGLFGYSAEEAQALTLSDLFPEFEQDNQHISGSGEQILQAKRKDENIFDAAISMSIIPAGKTQKQCFIIRDVSYKKQAEERLIQAQKMEAIGEITSTVAHNFNNLLSIISGSVQAIKKQGEDYPVSIDQIMMHTDTIESAAHRGMAQISRLMMFARKGGDKAESKKYKTLNLSSFIEDLKDLIVMSVRSDVDVTFDLKSDIHDVKIDKIQLESVLLNMAVNAVDAMPQGGQFHISTENVELDENYSFLSPDVKVGHYVCLTVSDTGQGIAPHVINHIFEPFYTTKPVGKGTGLGMSVVYGFIKQMNGYIHTYSELGCGTTFKIYLPACSEKKVISIVDRLIERGARRPSKTVLIIDDHILMQDMAAQSFKRLGFKVFVAGNDREASQLIEHIDQPIDLMFVDMFLDNKKISFDLVNKIKQGAHQNSNVLYTSGYDAQHLSNLYDMSGKAFMPKPFSHQKLIGKLQEFWPDDSF